MRALTLVVCGVVALAGAAHADDAEVKQLREEVAKLRDKLTNTEVDLLRIQNRNKQLEERIRELEKENERLRKKDGTPAGGANRPAEKVEGLVKSVDAKSGLVTISIGSDAGLAKGHTLDVYRLKPAPKYLGQIEIIDVSPTKAVGKPLGKAKDAIQEGDSVSSGVLNPAEERWGTVKGKVTWDGKMPDGKSEEFVINATNKGVKNVFVWLVDLSDPKNPKPPPINPALKLPRGVRLSIEQVGPAPRRFEPHVLALEAKQRVRLENATTANDNVTFVGAVPGPAVAVAAGDEAKVVLAGSPKPYVIESAIFPAMKGWARVFDHPYFALTDVDGKFEIKGAPAGKYNIVMWQEGVGWVNGGKFGKAIEIPAGKAVEVNEKAKPEE